MLGAAAFLLTSEPRLGPTSFFGAGAAASSARTTSEGRRPVIKKKRDVRGGGRSCPVRGVGWAPWKGDKGVGYDDASSEGCACR
jgi:hypothetical protein